MAPRLAWLAYFLGIWVANSLAFVFTNSFDDWVGNKTYSLAWQTTINDPEYYDLTIARPVRPPTPGQAVYANTPVDYYYTFAKQIPRTEYHSLDLILPSALLPGVYVMLMTGANNTALTPAFEVGLNELPTTSASPLLSGAAPATTTYGTYVEVTATASALVTQDGHTVTVKPSDVFSSAVVYTTIIVAGGPGKGVSPEKIQMIVGLVLGIGALVTLPIIVWLVLRYRRRPRPSDDDIHRDKHTPYQIENAGSSGVELLEQRETNAGGTRGVWTIVGGEKRFIPVPQNTRQPEVGSPNPFADPVHTHTPSRPQHLPRLSIPNGTIHTNAPQPTTPANQNASNPTPPGPSPSNTVPSLGRSQIEEKVSQARSQRPSPSTPRTLTSDDISSRMFVPGRAVDMGPLGRAHAGDVDENGLLPPDYSQATQPLSSSNATRPGASI